ncbi:Methionine aminopeptidase 1 [Gracilariopsis chorda]|uniref:Methionine aminopeptidase n=1 Tax=Gracilariopsis chorda TaxID=448386 RepID=A0A2V3IZ59_9FLOR|nr:Methionine aminopeptidase 1 [Gracilariopsis chorda]|eukprot:PXF47446.1 Methionine aminopeptidase 1 [Gracilariopsis chorda]
MALSSNSTFHCVGRCGTEREDANGTSVRPENNPANMKCATSNCEKEASLRCPTCVKLEIDLVEQSYFCTQDCFRAAWPTHKQLHKGSALPRGMDPSAKRRRAAFDRFNYTGDLRVADLVLPMRTVPASIPHPDYAVDGVPTAEERFNRTSTKFVTLDEQGIAAMRKVCRLAREVLDMAVRAAKVGVTTEQIDHIVHQACIDRQSYPSPLNYYGFPKACCTSVNEVICHGIPDKRPLQDGDILNIDITLYHEGYHGDLNETICIGNVSQQDKNLIRTAHDSMWAAIKRVKPGVLFRELGAYIEKVARANGHSVVRSYCGHGIGEQFHTAPNVPHYRKNRAVGMCKPGMCFTIEPMINGGNWRDDIWPDNWTAVTADGHNSAQFEHTILVTKEGFEVLTARLPDGPKFWWEEEG